MSADPFALSSASRSPELADEVRRTSLECVGRFARVYAELDHARSWYEPRAGVLFAAALAVGADGEADESAEAVVEARRQIGRATHWWQTTWQNRWLLAGLCAELGEEPGACLARIEAARRAFRDHKLKRAGAYALAAAALADDDDPDAWAERLGQVYRGLKRRRRFVTGTDDYPGCALVACHAATADELLERVATARARLTAVGLQDGNHLQRAALLHTAGEGDEAAAKRAADVGAGLLHRGVRIVALDYPELALLGLIDAPSNVVVERVLVHRKVVGTLIHGWQPQLQFQLAVAVAAWSLAVEVGDPASAVARARRLSVACSCVGLATAHGATTG